MIINFKVQMAIYLLSVGMIIFVTFLLLIKGKKTPLLYSFLAFQFVVLLWLLRIIFVKAGVYIEAYAIRGHDGVYNFELREFNNYKLKYYIVCAVGLCWLVFCMFYTESNIVKSKIKLGFVIILMPVLFYLPTISFINKITSDDIQNSTFIMYEILTHISYYIGIGLLIKKSFGQSQYLKRQSYLLSIAILIPIVLNFLQDYKRYFLHTAGIIYDFDITPVGFVFAMLIITFAAYRYRFLDVMPVALRKLIDYIREGIIFVDSLNVIMDYNEYLIAIFEKLQTTKRNVSIDVFIKDIEAYIVEDDGYHEFMTALKGNEHSSIKCELRFLSPINKYISVKIDPIYQKNNKIIGRVICFTDVTEYKHLVNTINEKNYKLTELNVQLEDYAASAEELAVTRERNRVARDIHDTLGHTMTVLIALLEAASIKCSDKDEETYSRLREAAFIAREGLKEVRRSVEGLAPVKLENNYIVPALQKLIESFESIGIHIDLTIDGASNELDAKYVQAIYRMVQEAITNAIRHGGAKHIDVIIKFTSEKVKLFIIDDGQGCSTIIKGFGLLGMEQRANNLNGKIVYGSDGERGFNVHVEFPLNNLKNEVLGRGFII